MSTGYRWSERMKLGIIMIEILIYSDRILAYGN